ncbi:MAG: ATP-binding cassette domain-containing protein [Planctomycetes bacterium]|nr:ATP-binding cassette domain-containing protein [Planctomycetota bacterium]MCB9905599.1 ATP-binding cassette domain-containing protein [Planctomycetota bacterium]
MICDVVLALDAFELQVSFETEARAIGVFGPSGAGKTSLLECIAGWRTPSRGRVEVAGRVLYDSASGVALDPRVRGVGYVPQDGLLFPHWTVERNLRAADLGRGVPADALATAIEVLELGPLLSRDVSTCSGGERQRVALGRALASNPDLLLLDEPLGALDRPLRRRILPYLVRATEAFDVPLIFVSHDPTEVQAICSEVVVVESGKLVARGNPAAVLGASERAGMDFENLLRGELELDAEGRAHLVLEGGVRVEVPSRGARRGTQALFGLRADDILLALEEPVGLSARNRLRARVERLDADGQDVLLSARCLGPSGAEGPLLRASLTVGAQRELGLVKDGPVQLVFKTQSCHPLG